MTGLLPFVAMAAVIVVSWLYSSVKRENRELRQSLLADDASALWVYVMDSVFSLRRHDSGEWTCNGDARAVTPEGAVRKHRAMKLAAERVEAELREDGAK